jgi:DNA helicase-2/ATP-dependent DNA helicase PcrA
MKERLSQMVEEVEDIWISTFHSMCVKILRRHISSLKSAKNPMHQVNFDSNFSIYTDTERDKALKTVLQNLKIEKDGFEKKVSFHISNAKNNNLSPWDYQKLNQYEEDIEQITKVYSAYQSFLASNNALFTSSSEYLVNEELSSSPSLSPLCSVSKVISSRFKASFSIG